MQNIYLYNFNQVENHSNKSNETKSRYHKQVITKNPINMKNQILLSVYIAITAVFLNITPCKATVWRVNNNPNYTQGCSHCFSSLQAANDTSIVVPGDTIHLEASNMTYTGLGGLPGEVVINKHLVILEPGYFLNLNAGFQNNSESATVERIRFSFGADNSIIKGIRIYRVGGGSDITILTSNIEVENCYIDEDINFDITISINNIIIGKCYINYRIYVGNTSNNVSNLYKSFP